MMKTRAIKTPANWKELSHHPLSQMFAFGEDIDLQGMAEHMKAHGYDEDEPVILFEGMILGARHRHAAARIAGIIPPFKEFIGKDPLAYVQKELYRRHVSVAKRAAAAAKFATRHAGKQNLNSPNGEVTTPSMTNAEAAKMFGVSERSVSRAKARARKPGKPRSKSGEVLFDWSEFKSKYGALYRQMDVLGNAYNCKESPAAEGLRRTLEEWRKRFKDWAQFHTKQTPPE